MNFYQPLINCVDIKTGQTSEIKLDQIVALIPSIRNNILSNFNKIDDNEISEKLKTVTKFKIFNKISYQNKSCFLITVSEVISEEKNRQHIFLTSEGGEIIKYFKDAPVISSIQDNLIFTVDKEEQDGWDNIKLKVYSF